MMMEDVAILIVLTTGGISGLIGLGGGVFIVPALLYVFKMSQHEAQGTSLATLLLPMGLFGFLEYYRQAHVDLRIDRERQIQMTRMAQIQAEVDQLRSNLKKLAGNSN